MSYTHDPTGSPTAEPAHTTAPPHYVQEENHKVAGYVYFIQADAGGPVKIGWARDPSKRLRELQTGSPHRLLVRARQPGTLADEARLHRRFAASRLTGEWFTPTAEMERIAGVKLVDGHTPPLPPQAKPIKVLLCDTCRQREASVIDLRPWATWNAAAHLLCDRCPSEGYWLEITDWIADNDDWRRHLIESKDGGNGCINAIEERLRHKDTLVLRYAPPEQ